MTETNSPRLKREKKTLELMLKIYCNGNHDTDKDLCGECKDLLNYALERLDKCRFKTEKTVCNKCPVHCYKKTMREKIKAIMRYSGPRMLKHPIMVFWHWADSKKKAPELKK